MSRPFLLALWFAMTIDAGASAQVVPGEIPDRPAGPPVERPRVEIEVVPKIPLGVPVPAIQPAIPAAAAPVPAGGKKDPANDVVLWIEHELLNEDLPDPVRNRPAKVHAFKAVKGQMYVIDMISAVFDSYLRLEDSGHNRLAEDDDGGGNLNSRIRFTAKQDGIHFVYASHLGGGEGRYTLTIQSHAPVKAKLTPLPAPTAAKAAEIAAQLTPKDAPCEDFQNRPAKFHSVELKAGKRYVVDLASQQFDTYLILQDAAGAVLARDDDGGDNTNSRIRYQPRADAVVRVIATTFNGQFGEFTLRIAEEP